MSEAVNFAPPERTERAVMRAKPRDGIRVVDFSLLRDFPMRAANSVVIVEMDEGVRLVSGLRALELPVEVVLETVAEGNRFPLVGSRSNRSRRP